MSAKRYQRTWLSRCIRLAGSVPAGVLLFYLKSAPPNRKVNHRDMVAISREELARRTELTPNQVRTGLQSLYERGWIVAEQHLSQGRTINHFIVTTAFYEAFESDAIKYLEPAEGE